MTVGDEAVVFRRNGVPAVAAQYASILDSVVGCELFARKWSRTRSRFRAFEISIQAFGISIQGPWGEVIPVEILNLMRESFGISNLELQVRVNPRRYFLWRLGEVH
jgi:hypothetical protein